MPPRPIGIVDYGLGNLASVAGAVEKLGHLPVVSSNPEELAQTDRLVLPGVGAFGDGMRFLAERDLRSALDRMVLAEKKPILGICLGAQLLGRQSTEFGKHAGLGWVDANVTRLTPQGDGLRVPHVGWNEVLQCRGSALFAGIPDRALFYFVHSFCITDAATEIVAGECDYGGRFPAVLDCGNVVAAQFHPEKSQTHGLAFLRNFIENLLPA